MSARQVVKVCVWLFCLNLPPLLDGWICWPKSKFKISNPLWVTPLTTKFLVTILIPGLHFCLFFFYTDTLKIFIPDFATFASWPNPGTLTNSHHSLWVTPLTTKFQIFLWVQKLALGLRQIHHPLWVTPLTTKFQIFFFFFVGSKIIESCPQKHFLLVRNPKTKPNLT